MTRFGMSLAVLLLILASGCSPSASAVTRNIQRTPEPTTFDALSGCTNPNTGVGDNNWGIGSGRPVYTTARTLLIGHPKYATNTLFWISRETKPGESVLLTGAFTPGPKSVRILPIQPSAGKSEWRKAVVKANEYPVNQQSPMALMFTIPSTFPPGEYGFEIVDPSANFFFGLANQPLIQWAVGVPPESGAQYALQGHITDCAAQPGGVLRIFGKNFSAATMPALLQNQATGIYRQLRAIDRADATAMTLRIPEGITPGPYNLWLGGVPWSTQSSNAVKIRILAPERHPINSVTCTLAANGKTDDTTALQSCLDKDAPIAPGLTYINIAAGKYLLTRAVTPRPGEIIQGASGPSGTVFLLSSTAPPKIWFALSHSFGMAQITVEGSVLSSIFGSLDRTGNPNTSGHFYFYDVTVRSHFIGLPSRGPLVLDLHGPDIQVYNSKLYGDAFMLLVLDKADGAVISGNVFSYINWTGNSIENSQNVVWENNTISSPNAPVPGTDIKTAFVAGSGLQIAREFIFNSASVINQNIYIGYNDIHHTGIQGQQIVAVDGGAGAYFGPIDAVQSTASAVVLANDPSWKSTGDTNPQTLTIAISAGTGAGQFSLIKSYTGRRITLIAPWKVLPDATSTVVIASMQNNLQYVHNTITDTLGATLVLGDSADSVIEDNALTNSGYGILIAGFGPYGSPASYNPVEHMEVFRNLISPGKGTYIVQSRNKNLAGIGIVDFPGIILSGILIRDNIVPAINTIYPTDGWNLYAGVLVERNHAIWFDDFKLPGLTVQNNFPPVN